MITPCLPIVLVARWYTHSSLRKSSLHIITNIYMQMEQSSQFPLHHTMKEYRKQFILIRHWRRCHAMTYNIQFRSIYLLFCWLGRLLPDVLYSGCLIQPLEVTLLPTHNHHVLNTILVKMKPLLWSEQYFKRYSRSSLFSL